MKTKTVTINNKQSLFVIPCDGGYSCLGFDVCMQRATALAKELGEPFSEERGTIAAYNSYRRLCAVALERNRRTGWRSETELTPQLRGLEGRRVAVVDCYGEARKFWVGKSTGFIPCHLEIKTRRSDGGPAVMGAPFRSVTVIG